MLPATRLAWILSVIAALLISGCATRGGPIPYDPTVLAAPDNVTANALPQDLPLGPLDRVRVNVFRVPDLSGEYQVTGDGFLDMPLIGRVDVRDRTADQAAELLRQRYGRDYLKNPDISLRVLESNQRNITVEGGVRSPGVYPVAGRTTLITAVALAKGINPEDGNQRRIAIFRTMQGQRMAAAFDLVAIRQGKMEDPAVFPGDTIVVDSNSLRSIYRDLLQTLPILAVFGSI
jgi:polysaccharide export outer membrane protein